MPMSKCQWCGDVEVANPCLCFECKQEPDAVEYKQAADAAGIPATTVLTTDLFPVFRKNAK
jgi:hypothetical protein